MSDRCWFLWPTSRGFLACLYQREFSGPHTIHAWPLDRLPIPTSHLMLPAPLLYGWSPRSFTTSFWFLGDTPMGSFQNGRKKGKGGGVWTVKMKMKEGPMILLNVESYFLGTQWSEAKCGAPWMSQLNEGFYADEVTLMSVAGKNPSRGQWSRRDVSIGRVRNSSFILNQF